MEWFCKYIVAQEEGFSGDFDAGGSLQAENQYVLKHVVIQELFDSTKTVLVIDVVR